jgi:DNA repair exonuclease SbcCD ATPase subunit
MYSILNIELKNFIGLRKISDKTGLFNITFENDLDKTYFLIFGENGQGKTTLLENLTPFSRMFSRPMNVSIEFPAHKKIEFINTATNEKIRIETYWKEDGHTKGYIYLNESTEPTIETSKGNITEFNYQIEKIFGSYDKFKNSLFLQQGILEIVKSSPTERIKIINNFISDLSIYNSIKQQSVQEIEIIKSKIKEYEKKQSEYKTFENKYIQLSNFEEKQSIYNLGDRQVELKEMELKIDKLKQDEIEYRKLIIEIEEYENKIKELEIKEPIKNLKVVKDKIKDLEVVDKTYLEDSEYIKLITLLQTGIEYNNKIIDIVMKNDISIDIDYLINNIKDIELKLLELEQIKNSLMIKVELETKLIELNNENEILGKEETKITDMVKDIEEELKLNSIEMTDTELILRRDNIKDNISVFNKKSQEISAKQNICGQIDIGDTQLEIKQLENMIIKLEKELLNIEKIFTAKNIEELRVELNTKLREEKEIAKILNIDKSIEEILNIVNKYDIYYSNLITEISKVEELEEFKRELLSIEKKISALPTNIHEIVSELSSLDIEVIENKLNTLLIDIEKLNFLKKEVDKKKLEIADMSNVEEAEKLFKIAKTLKEDYKKKLEVKKHLIKYLETDTITCECCDSSLNRKDIEKKLLEYSEIEDMELIQLEQDFEIKEQLYFDNKIKIVKTKQLLDEIFELEQEIKGKKIDYEEYDKLQDQKNKIKKYSSICNDYSKLNIEKTNILSNMRNIKTLGKTLEELYNIKSDYINLYLKVDSNILNNFSMDMKPMDIIEKLKKEIEKINLELIDYELLVKDKISIKDEIMTATKKEVILKEQIYTFNTLSNEIILLEEENKNINIDSLNENLIIIEKNIERKLRYNILLSDRKIQENNLTNIFKNKTTNQKAVAVIEKKLLSIKIDSNLEKIEAEIVKLKILMNLRNNLGGYINSLEKLTINKDNLTGFIKMTETKQIEIKNINETLQKKELNKVNISKLKNEENNLNILGKEISFYTVEVNKKKISFDKIKYISQVDIKDSIYKYNTLKKEVEQFIVEQTQYQENKEWIEATLEIYKQDKKEFEENEKDLYMYTKIKNYSDRIRKAFVGSFFANITETINDIISNDFGTLGNLKVEINQTRADKFDILVREDNDDFVNDVNDISLLSGAEQATVARAIYFALAQFTNFGILWLDEYDGMLSETNKDGFVKMLDKIKDNLSIKQIFIISHDKNMIANVDRVVYL